MPLSTPESFILALSGTPWSSFSVQAEPIFASSVVLAAEVLSLVREEGAETDQTCVGAAAGVDFATVEAGIIHGWFQDSAEPFI